MTSKILKGIMLSEARSEYGANLDWAAGKASQDTNEPQKYAIEVGPNKYVGDIYTDWNEADRKRKELAKKYFQVKVVPISKMNEAMAENSMPYPHGKPESGDKITWYHSNHYPEIEGTVLGWKDGHLIVQSVDPQPRNTEKTVAKYRVPKNNILSVKKQGVSESSEEKKECGNCHGSGRMVWDADIGTDQECFVCDGTGEVDWNDDEKDDVKEGYDQAAADNALQKAMVDLANRIKPEIYKLATGDKHSALYAKSVYSDVYGSIYAPYLRQLFNTTDTKSGFDNNQLSELIKKYTSIKIPGINPVLDAVSGWCHFYRADRQPNDSGTKKFYQNINLSMNIAQFEQMLSELIKYLGSDDAKTCGFYGFKIPTSGLSEEADPVVSYFYADTDSTARSQAMMVIASITGRVARVAHRGSIGTDNSAFQAKHFNILGGSKESDSSMLLHKFSEYLVDHADALYQYYEKYKNDMEMMGKILAKTWKEKFEKKDWTGMVESSEEKETTKGSVTSNFKIGPKSEYDKGKADSYYGRRDRSAESPDPKEYLRGYDENDDYKDWGRDDPVDEGTSNILKGISRMVKGKPTPSAEYQKYFDAYKKAMQTGDKAAIANATRDLHRIEKVAGPAFFEGLGLPFPGTYEQERGLESADEKLDEKWSDKYKRSIDCSHPKGFSQRAHCQGKKKK
jgi:hypothetical protein